MIFINLDKMETANNLVKICERYSDYMEVDVHYERYVVNGVSILAIASLFGNIVRIVPRTEDALLKGYFVRDITEIGAWVKD